MNKDQQQFEAAIANAKKHYRTMPWRQPQHLNGYHILVSECMLQQTQVSRVEPKFNQFVSLFPTIQALAKASLEEVLRAWNGLGYNRRAKYLHEAARTLQYFSEPWTYEQLIACKGIGPNTAKAILVYAYNEPHIFIETNIRTVCIQYLFDGVQQVEDSEIVKAMEHLVDTKNPRQWYWSVMDEGYRLKKLGSSHLHRAKAHKKQSKFEGSVRQVRGRVIKLLLEESKSMAQLSKSIADPRLDAVVEQLANEGLVEVGAGVIRLKV